MKVTPAPPRARVAEGPDGLRITLPVRPSRFLVAVLGIWLIIWIVALVAVLFAGFRGAPSLFLVGWLLVWMGAGGLVGSIWLWNVAGREVLLLHGQQLLARREVAGVGRSREFDLAHVRHLRAAPTTSAQTTAAPFLWHGGAGSLAFDYGAETYRYGAGVDEAEARDLVEVMRRRLPTASDR